MPISGSVMVGIAGGCVSATGQPLNLHIVDAGGLFECVSLIQCQSPVGDGHFVGKRPKFIRRKGHGVPIIHAFHKQCVRARIRRVADRYGDLVATVWQQKLPVLKLVEMDQCVEPLVRIGAAVSRHIGMVAGPSVEGPVAAVTEDLAGIWKVMVGNVSAGQLEIHLKGVARERQSLLQGFQHQSRSSPHRPRSDFLKPNECPACAPKPRRRRLFSPEICSRRAIQFRLPLVPRVYIHTPSNFCEASL